MIVDTAEKAIQTVESVENGAAGQKVYKGARKMIVNALKAGRENNEAADVARQMTIVVQSSKRRPKSCKSCCQ